MSEAIEKPVVMPATERVVAGLFASGFAGGAAAVAWLDPVKTSVFPACPLLSFTGIACPGCGLTRGLHAFFHGDIGTALDFNAMIPVYVLLFGFLFLSLTLTAVRGRGIDGGSFLLRCVYGVVGLAAVFTILRNLPFEPFRILYP